MYSQDSSSSLALPFILPPPLEAFGVAVVEAGEELLLRMKMNPLDSFSELGASDADATLSAILLPLLLALEEEAGVVGVVADQGEETAKADET